MLTVYDQRGSGESSGGCDGLQNDDVRNNSQQDDGEPIVRDIHALTSPENRSHALPPPPPTFRRYFNSPARSTGAASLSDDVASSAGAENFTTISREFNALVLAGSSMDHHNNNNSNNSSNTGYNSNNNNNNNEENNNNYQMDPFQSSSNHDRDLTRLGERLGEVPEEEMNPLAIVPDGIGPSGPGPVPGLSLGQGAVTGSGSVQRARREEVEAKIVAWQNAKLAKISNRFKREDAIITGWENEQVHKANSWMKKVERKLEEKRARAMEKMQNEVARARGKAQERRATAEGKRGTEVAKVLELSNLMRAVGRPPSKRSFFSFH